MQTFVQYLPFNRHFPCAEQVSVIRNPDNRFGCDPGKPAVITDKRSLVPGWANLLLGVARGLAELTQERFEIRIRELFHWFGSGSQILAARYYARAHLLVGQIDRVE